MRIEDVFRKLKPVSGMDMARLWAEYILSDSGGRKAIENSLRISLARRLKATFEEKEVLLEPPAEDIASGEYPLGLVVYGRQIFGWFGLREREWVQHVGVFGRSGSGKTNTAFLIVLNLLARGKPFLVFDWKRNYRDLLALVPDREILVFTVGRPVSPFSFNPLIPPDGTLPAVWLKKLIEILCHAYFLGEGVAYLLQKAMDSVYREFGVYSGNKHEWPTFMDVREWLERYKARGREASWMESALRAVGVLCFGEVSRVINRRDAVNLAGLLERNVVLELDSLTNSDKTFLIESLLLWIHHYRLGQQGREEFRHALIIEEAHHILLRKKQEASGEEAITDIILREIRELGEAVVLIDQHPSLISKPALGNTYTTIAMNLKHRSDISMIADSLLIEAKQARYLGKLETGFAMVKLQGRWFEPFLVKFPLVKVRKGQVTDEDIAERMERAGFKAFGKEKVYGHVLKRPENVLKMSESGPVTLTKNEEILLRDIHEYPVSPVTERYERLGLNVYQGNKAKEGLISRGYVTVRDVKASRARLKVLELTEKARDALKSMGVQPGKSHRGGGVEHELAKKRLAEKYRSEGWRVVEEYPIGGGRTVDLALFRDGRKVAVEIETGKSNVAYNMKKCLDAGFDEVWGVRV